MTHALSELSDVHRHNPVTIQKVRASQRFDNDTNIEGSTNAVVRGGRRWEQSIFAGDIHSF